MSAPQAPAASRLGAIGPLPPQTLAMIMAAVMAGVAAVALATGGRGARVAEAGGDLITDAALSLGLRLAEVHVQGASPEASADILRAADLRRGAPLLGLDLDAVRQRVDKVGWVKSAQVIRLLPDTVVIAVDQRQLVAVWEHAGRTGVVDADGVVAPEADPAKFSSLPLVVGEGANTAAASILPAITSRPRLAQRLEALIRVDDRRWDLRLKDGSIIQLPATDEEAALIRLDQLDQKARVLELGFARIDLRDPDMVAVRPRQTTPAGVGAEGAG
jgi:cell division protein FtsQ